MNPPALQTKRKTIAVVGNAPVILNHSANINGSDFVVRFNNCNNFNDNTGTTTHAWCMTNMGWQAKIYAEKNYFDRFKFSSQLSEVWFPRNEISHKYYIMACEGTDYFKRLRDQLVDRSADIISANQFAGRYVIFDRAINELAFLSLYAAGAPAFPMPSSGFLSLMYIVTDDRFRDHDINLFGFTFQGWDGHPWRYEKQVLERLSRVRRISFLG